MASARCWFTWRAIAWPRSRVIRRTPPATGLVEIHPATAASLGIRDGDWVWIEAPEGRVQMRAILFDGLALDVVNAQHAWWYPEDPSPEHGWKRSSVNLVFGDRTGYDPETGAECLRSTLCRMSPVEIAELSR